MKRKKNKKTRFRKIVKILIISVLGLLVMSILLPLLYRWVNPPITILMISRKIDGYEIRKQWVDIEDISPSLVSCVVAAEDNNFLGHNGFDFGAIQKAIDERKKGRFRGASTISQQTAKNVFLWETSSWLRKGLEVYFTFWIERFWSKKRIMEVYLNVIEMGGGIYGVAAASEVYFHKTAKKITPYQSALLTAALPSPLHRNPARPSAYMSSRAGQILAVSHKIGKVKFDKESIQKAQKRYEKREDKRRKKNGDNILKIN